MEKVLRLLIIEDSGDDVALLIRELRKGGYNPVFEWVDNPEAVAKALSKDAWDLVISDYMLPGFGGLMALEMVQKTGMDTPFIVVSGKVGEETAVELMKAGAHDYLMKNNLARLIPAVERELKEAEVRRERRRAESELFKSYAEMEKRIEERTRDLRETNESLQREIAERRQAEQALRESEEKYSSLVRQSRDGIFLVQDEVIKYVNQALTSLSGFETEELLGMPVFGLVTPACRGEIMDLYNRVLSGEKAPRIKESQILRKDGTVKDIEISAALIQYHGHPAVMGTVRDITGRKQLEAERLTSSKLQSIGILAGGIAHDFNNMLTAILGNISLAKIYARPGDKVFSKLLEIERASLQTKDLTQQLFTFSKGGASLKKVSKINKMIKDVATFAVRGAKTRCQFSIPEDLWAVEIDEAQIGQVINNLIINADQAMPQGGIIRVRAENVAVGLENMALPGPGDYVRITIQDQGIGIPKEHLTKIFDPYFTTKQKGSGLGLATSYSIIRNHNGYINVESEIGSGIRVCVYLPAARATALNQKEPDEKRQKIESGKGKILIMDDEDMVRTVAGELLAHLGYQVNFARDGAEAVSIFEGCMKTGQPFDAIIMDLTVPGGMGGKEALKIIREIDPKVKALLSSGYSNDPIMSDYRNYGFIGVISKPYRIEDLSESLNGALKANNSGS